MFFARICLIFILFGVTLQTAVAKLDFEDHAFPEFVTSARALAMGNAYLNKADDSWAAFYNPAGLGSVRKAQFHLFNAHMEASSGLLDVIGNGPAYKVPGNWLNSFNMEDFREKLSEKKGTLTHSRFNIFPNITVRGLTLGYMFSQRNRAIVNNDADNKFEVAERQDQGPVMSLTASLFGGVFKVGATAVYLTRRDLYKAFDPADTIVINNSDYKKGRGLQVTASAKLTLPIALLPTFSGVLRNSTNNDFEGETMGGSPDRIKQTVDVGFSLTPQIGNQTRIHFEANLKDASDSYATDFKRRMAAGVELDFNRRIFLRGGFGDGWGSGGIGVRNDQFILDLTTYAVDRSLEGFREEEDRRWVASLSMGF